MNNLLWTERNLRMAFEQPAWITGLGAVTPIGTRFDEISQNLLSGKIGIRPVQGFDVSEHPCQIAGQIPSIACPGEIDSRLFAGLLPLEQCAVACCVDSLIDSGLWALRQTLRIGVVLGLGAERMQLWDADYRKRCEGKILFHPDQEPPSISERVRQLLQLTGPAMTVSAACASGNLALAQGCQWLKLGWVDVCVVGACDMGVSPYSLASFGNLRALSRCSDPQKALRPFDQERDGMVLGEGGAVFVLERADSARRRSVPVYAEVAGYGLTSDGTHLVIPSADPQQGIVAVRNAMAMAGVGPDEVDYVNAHATGTRVGDLCETRILQGAFEANCSKIPVSSTKSMTGHLMSAAAAVEAIACLTAMRYGAIPPTVNLDNPDPDCNLLHVANQPREQTVRIALSNSFGFGGNNTSLVLRSVKSTFA